MTAEGRMTRALWWVIAFGVAIALCAGLAIWGLFF